MAEEDTSKEDRTEAPTSRRLQNASQEGNVPVSAQSGQLLALIAGAASLASFSQPLTDSLVRAVNASATAIARADGNELSRAFVEPLGYGFVVTLTAGAAALGAGLFQTKGGFWPQKLAPDLKKLFSPQVLIRSFQKEGLQDLGLAMLRVILMSVIILTVLGDEFMALPMLVLAPPDVILAEVSKLIVKTVALSLFLFVSFAAIDVFLTHQRFTDKLKMTKEQVKREHKEDEGDPQIKGRRRRKHREFVQGRVAVEVPRADAVIVNPTHIAIAIRYRRGEDKAPRVTAKGKGAAAEIIRDLARTHGVPIMQDIPLARLLHKKVKVGGEVPAETYKAVAAVLAFAYRVRARGGTTS